MHNMDISKLKINESIYNVKDSVAREGLENVESQIIEQLEPLEDRVETLENTVNNILINYVGAYPIRNILFDVEEV